MMISKVGTCFDDLPCLQATTFDDANTPAVACVLNVSVQVLPFVSKGGPVERLLTTVFRPAIIVKEDGLSEDMLSNDGGSSVELLSDGVGSTTSVGRGERGSIEELLSREVDSTEAGGEGGWKDELPASSALLSDRVGSPTSVGKGDCGSTEELPSKEVESAEAAGKGDSEDVLLASSALATANRQTQSRLV